MAFHMPFDLSYWLLNVFAGSTLLFLIIGVIVLFMVAAYFRMPNIVAVMGLLLFLLLMAYYDISGTMIIVVIIALVIVSVPIIKRILGG